MIPAVTRRYHFPPAGLTAPPAEECSHEQLLDLALLASRSPSDLGALQGSPDHLRRICELLGAFHRHAVEQELELEVTRERLVAAGRMVSGARDQAAIVRNSLGVEVAKHRATKQQAVQEYELRIAAEEELRRVLEGHARDRERLARAMRLLAIVFDRTKRVASTLFDLSGDGDVTPPNVRALDMSPEAGSEETCIDILDARCVAAEPWLCVSTGKENQDG
jgi:hypothetical protein